MKATVTRYELGKFFVIITTAPTTTVSSTFYQMSQLSISSCPLHIINFHFQLSIASLHIHLYSSPYPDKVHFHFQLSIASIHIHLRIPFPTPIFISRATRCYLHSCAADAVVCHAAAPFRHYYYCSTDHYSIHQRPSTAEIGAAVVRQGGKHFH